MIGKCNLLLPIPYFSLEDSTLLTSSLAFGSLARFKIITDNADATDLFFHGFLLCCWISLRLACAMIVTDYLLLKAIQRRIGANTIRSKSNIKWQHRIK